MKKLVLTVIGIGMLNLAHAGSITLFSAGSTFYGTSSYLFLEQLAAGTQISGASVVFTGVELIASGGVPNTIYADLINGNSSASAFQTGSIGGSENNYDFFEHTGDAPYAGISDSLNAAGENFTSTYSPKTWTWTFAGTTAGTDLYDLQHDALLGEYFDIGINPNCTYYIPTGGSIVFNYTVTSGGGSNPTPDHAMTVSLLGMSFLGMIVFRRKLALN